MAPPNVETVACFFSAPEISRRGVRSARLGFVFWLILCHISRGAGEWYALMINKDHESCLNPEGHRILQRREPFRKNTNKKAECTY